MRTNFPAIRIDPGVPRTLGRRDRLRRTKDAPRSVLERKRQRIYRSETSGRFDAGIVCAFRSGHFVTRAMMLEAAESTRNMDIGSPLIQRLFSDSQNASYPNVMPPAPRNRVSRDWFEAVIWEMSCETIPTSPQPHQPARDQTQNVPLEQMSPTTPKTKTTNQNLCRISSYDSLNGIDVNPANLPARAQYR